MMIILMKPKKKKNAAKNHSIIHTLSILILIANCQNTQQAFKLTKINDNSQLWIIILFRRREGVKKLKQRIQ